MLSNKIIGTCYNAASKNFITQYKYLKTPVTFPEMWTVTSWRCWYSPTPVRWRARARSSAWCPTCPTRSRARCVNEAASPPSCSRRWWPMQVRVGGCCLTSHGLRRLYVVKCWCSIWWIIALFSFIRRLFTHYHNGHSPERSAGILQLSRRQSQSIAVSDPVHHRIRELIQCISTFGCRISAYLDGR